MRAWPATSVELEEKRAVVELSLDLESSVVEVAAAFDLVPAQIYAWRRELREVDIRASRRLLVKSASSL